MGNEISRYEKEENPDKYNKDGESVQTSSQRKNKSGDLIHSIGNTTDTVYGLERADLKCSLHKKELKDEIEVLDNMATVIAKGVTHKCITSTQPTPLT